LASCSIEELLPRRHDLSWPERLNLLCGITQGVHQLHKAGIVHRDIKSSNGLVHVDRNTGTCTSVLADLGRARDLTREASRPPHEYFAGMGDFRFAPPEALYLQTVNNPQLWRLTDLYGVGSLFFELATGQGITSYALGAGHDIVEALENTGELKRRALYDGHLTKIRARYADAFDHFATLVPDCIAEPSVTLLRQLCDPDPYRRLPGSGMRPCEPGLAWLERRVRILKLKAQIADRSKSGREEEKGMGGCC
jgi:serine/threonine protein kinase